MRDYGKVQTTFWTSCRITSLSDTGRMLALYLLTGPHTNQIGCFRLPDGYVSEDLGWSLETVQKGFEELSANGFATRDEKTKWVLITNFLVWNEIENPNQGKSAFRLFEQVPASFPLRGVLAKGLLGFEERFTEDVVALLKGFAQGLNQPLAKPFLNQEQEQEQEQDINNTNVLYADSSSDGLADDHDKQADKPKRSTCPHQEIIALYHELLPASPQIRDWTPARADLLRVRWNEDASRQDLDWWRRFFSYIAESQFLTGRAHANGRKPFMAPLEWILKAENFAKIREGRYHEGEA